MRRKEKLNLTKFLIYVSIFIFISIFTNLILSVNIYRSEISERDQSYTDYVLLNNIAITDYSLRSSESYFDYIYNQFTLNSNYTVMKTDLPSFVTDSLIDTHRYDVKDALDIRYKDIHNVIEINQEYNINENDNGKIIFFYNHPEYEYPIIVISQSFDDDDIRLVAKFKMPYHSILFKQLNDSIDKNKAYYFFIEHTDHIVPFGKVPANFSMISDLYTENSKNNQNENSIGFVESSNYDYRCAYYIDETKSSNSFFIIMSLFAILNILFFAVFITVYNHYKTSKIESSTDLMTGLYNRGYLFSRINYYIKKKRYPISFIVIDVDYLKFINDTYGHLKGDEAISKIADILKSVFRENDIVARIGGDEFAVLLANTHKDVVSILIERILQCIEDSNAKNPDDLPISVSTGFYVTENNIENAEYLFENADEFMYKNKEESHKKYEAILIKWCKKHNVAPPKPRK